MTTRVYFVNKLEKLKVRRMEMLLDELANPDLAKSRRFLETRDAHDRLIAEYIILQEEFYEKFPNPLEDAWQANESSSRPEQNPGGTTTTET